VTTPTSRIGCRAVNGHLKDVGEHFNECLLRYVDESEQRDFPWRYSERPLVGMLSAAVWLAGGVSLEEYWTKKKKLGGKSYGRIDLFFKIGGTSYIAEAKHMYLNLLDCDDGWRNGLGKRCKQDSKANQLDKGECAVGVAFWSIRYRGGLADVQGRVKGLVAGIEKNEDSALTVWHFPAWALNEQICHGEKNIRYAGLVMQIFVTGQSAADPKIEKTSADRSDLKKELSITVKRT